MEVMDSQALELFNLALEQGTGVEELSDDDKDFEDAIEELLKDEVKSEPKWFTTRENNIKTLGQCTEGKWLWKFILTVWISPIIPYFQLSITFYFN